MSDSGKPQHAMLSSNSNSSSSSSSSSAMSTVVAPSLTKSEDLKGDQKLPVDLSDGLSDSYFDSILQQSRVIAEKKAATRVEPRYYLIDPPPYKVSLADKGISDDMPRPTGWQTIVSTGMITQLAGFANLTPLKIGTMFGENTPVYAIRPDELPSEVESCLSMVTRALTRTEVELRAEKYMASRDADFESIRTDIMGIKLPETFDLGTITTFIEREVHKQLDILDIPHDSILSSTVDIKQLEALHVYSAKLYESDAKLEVKGLDEDIKTYVGSLDGSVKSVVSDLMKVEAEINGHATTMTAGQAKTYIEQKNYFQWVIDSSGKMPRKLLAKIEDAFNWQALGKGKTGVYAAAVRRGLRPYYSTRRECNIIRVNGISDEIKVLLKEYTDVLVTVSKVAAIFRVNAKSFAAQSGANMYTKMHHWDAQSTNEYKALFNALDLRDAVSADDFRPIVYLSVHPLPLHVTNAFRKAAMGNLERVSIPVEDRVLGVSEVYLPVSGYVNTVVMRCHGTAAGNAPFAICASALRIMNSETYAGRLFEFIERTSGVSSKEVFHEFELLRRFGENFHAMAKEFHVKPMSIDKERYAMWMTIACAYIFEVSKGSMRKSKALAKFRDEHARLIESWTSKFRKQREEDDMSVDEFLDAVTSGSKNPRQQTKKYKELLKIADLRAEVTKTLEKSGMSAEGITSLTS